MKAGYSDAFSMTFRSNKNEEGYDCYGAKSGYSTANADTNTWAYEKVTTEQPPRDITSYTGSPYPECPTVWQIWTSDDYENNWTGELTKQAQGSKIHYAWDKKVNTVAETQVSSFDN